MNYKGYEIDIDFEEDRVTITRDGVVMDRCSLADCAIACAEGVIDAWKNVSLPQRREEKKNRRLR